MPELTSKEKWSICLEYCKSRLTEHEFKTWILPMSFCSYNNDRRELKVNIPSHYFYEFLEANYASIILAAIHQEFGKGTRLIYKILTDRANRISQDVASITQPMPAPVNPNTLSGTSTPIQQGTAVKEKPEIDSHLLTEYNFDNFIEGTSNILPLRVGLSIAENPKQQTFNPLFVYGHSGVGKTHLVNAIGMKLKENFPEKQVLYLSAHLFHVQFVDANLKNKVNDFIRFYQQIDVLIIDDIQEFIGMAKTQNTFFHIFNHLKQNGKQIILTCDRPPVDLQGMEERMLTRFKWGLQAELGQPNEQLRHDILENKIHRNGLKIPKQVVDYISENVTESVRELEGIITSLVAHSIFFNREIDLNMAKHIVGNATKAERKPITVDDIIAHTCAYCKVKKEDVFSKSRKANIVEVRQIAMYLAQKFTQLSISKIGILVGNRNHTTVIYSVRAVQDQMDSDPKFKNKVEEIEENVRKHKPIES